MASSLAKDSLDMADTAVLIEELSDQDLDSLIRRRVEESLADSRPPIPHADVMARIDSIIAGLENKR